MKDRTLLLAFFCVALACGGSSRFALRPPVLRDTDDRPLARAPARDEETDLANSLDTALLRPISHAFLFQVSGESRNVNSLDEVPDSTWFTNRAVTAEQIARGPCPAFSEPETPFRATSSKIGGTTPGIVVEDARGRKYLLKTDELTEYGQPEMSTAADAIVSRLYWAIGFNAPCNDVVFVDESDIQIKPGALAVGKTGKKRPLTREMVHEVLHHATRRWDDKIRLSASLYIGGQNVGTWRAEGRRSDDANDVIPHEDRRELRGEYFLASWVQHWDVRGPNTFDAFIPSPRGAGGYVLHYMLDFSDSLGGTSARVEWREPRVGFESVGDAPTIFADMFTFGLDRHAWDDIVIDWMYPNLGTFEVAHYDPKAYSPQTPVVRFARAQTADLAWMARKIARLGLDEVRAAVHAGKLSRPLEEARLVEVLWGRRDKILRESFAESSPLAQIAIDSGDRVCAVDLGIETELSKPEGVRHLATFRGSPLMATRSGARVCVTLPHFAPTGVRDDSPDRYAIVDLVRIEAGRKTLLRAHVYDLGATRGYFLAGVERP